MKRLFAIFTLCFISLHCFGQDEVLKYIKTSSLSGKVYPVGGEEPYGHAGGIEVRFLGESLWCNFYDRASQEGFKLDEMQSGFYSFVKIEDDQIVFEKQIHPIIFIVKISKDRKTILFGNSGIKPDGNRIEVNWDKASKYVLKENDLPYWMIHADNSIGDYQGSIDKIKIYFKNNGKELYCKKYEKMIYEGTNISYKIVKEGSYSLAKIDHTKKRLLYYPNIDSDYKDVIIVSFDRKTIYCSFSFNARSKTMEELIESSWAYKSRLISRDDENLPSWMK